MQNRAGTPARFLFQENAPDIAIVKRAETVQIKTARQAHREEKT